MASPSPAIRTVGVPREVKTAEHRVAMTPDGVRELERHGIEVRVEAGAGEGASISDADYVAAGADIVPTAADAWAQDMVVKVKEPKAEEFDFLRPDLTLFTYLHLAAYPAVAEALLAAGTTAVAYETVQLPDGSLPLLAPMSEVAGRLAPQMGAHFLERHNGGRGVLMGGSPGVRPAKVVVLGAGNVGWNAAWIAAGMEAEVVLIDKNLDRLRFVDQIHRGRIMTAASNRGAIERAVIDADLVIGAVLVAGGRAPVVVAEELVRADEAALGDRRRGGRSGRLHRHHPRDDARRADLRRARRRPLRGRQHAGAVPHTSTYALTNATLPYQLDVALHGAIGAARRDPSIAHGLNTVGGEHANAPSPSRSAPPPSTPSPDRSSDAPIRRVQIHVCVEDFGEAGLRNSDANGGLGGCAGSGQSSSIDGRWRARWSRRAASCRRSVAAASRGSDASIGGDDRHGARRGDARRGVPRRAPGCAAANARHRRRRGSRSRASNAPGRAARR